MTKPKPELETNLVNEELQEELDENGSIGVDDF